MVSTILEYPDIQKHMYSSEDFEEITSAGFTLSEQDNYFTVEIKGKQKIFIPKSIRRAIFWATHFPLHTGIRLTLNSLREQVFYWPKLEEDIQKFLSQCVCATKKTDKFKRKPHGQGICATHVLQICASGLYEYNSEHYFTLIDLFSEFPFCIIKLQAKKPQKSNLHTTNFAHLMQHQSHFFQTTEKNLP